jgi:hypothetical protein
MVCGAGRYWLTGRSLLPQAIAAALLVAGCGGSGVTAASASQSGIQALPGTSRSLSAPVNGSNLDYSGVAQPFSAPGVVAALTALRPGTLRYPGGTIANYWQWQTGTLVQPAQTVANGNGGRKNQPGQTHTYGFTLETLRSIVAETGTTPVFDLNVLTSTLADQLAMLKTASALGIPVRYIELGNEFYLSASNYTRAFPTATAYADLVARWAPQLKADFPDAFIAAVGSLPQVTQRETGWNQTVLSIAGADISALTLHDYPGIPRPGHTGTIAAAHALASAYADWKQDQTVMAAIPPRYSIWFTEFNLANQVRGEGSPPLGVTWLHGLYTAETAMLYDQSPRVQLDDYWDLFSAPTSGTFTTGASPRLTAAGSALTVLSTASWQATSVRALSFPGAPTLPGGTPGLAGLEFSGRSGTRTVLLNLTGQALSVRAGPAIPGGATAESISGNPAVEVAGSSGLTRHITKAGAALSVPPYSLVAVGFSVPAG